MFVLFQIFECISHLPVYLPIRASNTATPSRLRFWPRTVKGPGLFICAACAYGRVCGLFCKKALQYRAGLLLALPIER